MQLELRPKLRWCLGTKPEIARLPERPHWCAPTSPALPCLLHEVTWGVLQIGGCSWWSRIAFRPSQLLPSLPIKAHPSKTNMVLQRVALPYDRLNTRSLA